MMTSLLNLLTVVVSFIAKEREKYERRKFKEQVDAIRDDPMSEWDRRFKRVRDESPKEGELPPGDPKPKP